MTALQKGGLLKAYKAKGCRQRLKALAFRFAQAVSPLTRRSRLKRLLHCRLPLKGHPGVIDFRMGLRIP